MSGAVCTKQNDYYSQLVPLHAGENLFSLPFRCIPGSNPPTPSSSSSASTSSPRPTSTPGGGSTPTTTSGGSVPTSAAGNPYADGYNVCDGLQRARTISPDS